MSLPKTMKAIKVMDEGKAEIQEVPLPKLRDTYVLVKTKCVALNPTDWKHVHRANLGSKGHTVGVDYSGEVIEVGSKVTKPWKKGDRICGFVHGVNALEPEDGAFGEYLVAKADVQIKTPDNLSDEDASTLGAGVITCGQALYMSLKLPLPGEQKANIPFLVYGGSTATGSLAIQYAVLSGCQVVTTCSPRNFAFVKSLGAAEAFDYNDPDCAKKIYEFTGGKLEKVLDCIAEGQSPKICEDAIGPKGGVISYLLRAKHERKDVENRHTLGYFVTGEPKRFAGKDMPAQPEDFEFTKKFVDLTTKLLASSQLAVHPPKVGKGGLAGVLDGMEELRQGKVSGVKLVYRVSETP